MVGSPNRFSISDLGFRVLHCKKELAKMEELNGRACSIKYDRCSIQIFCLNMHSFVFPFTYYRGYTVNNAESNRE